MWRAAELVGGDREILFPELLKRPPKPFFFALALEIEFIELECGKLVEFANIVADGVGDGGELVWLRDAMLRVWLARRAESSASRSGELRGTRKGSEERGWQSEIGGGMGFTAFRNPRADPVDADDGVVEESSELDASVDDEDSEA